jgi:hypothetical protein
MKTQHTIEVIVGTAGEIRIEALAFQGADCERATRYLEDALGAIGARTKKPEYHQRSRRTAQQRLGQ